MTRSTLDDPLITVDMHAMAFTIRSAMDILSRFREQASFYTWAWHEPTVHVDYDGSIELGWYTQSPRRLRIAVYGNCCDISGIVSSDQSDPCFIQLANVEEAISVDSLDFKRLGSWYFGGVYAP